MYINEEWYIEQERYIKKEWWCTTSSLSYFEWSELVITKYKVNKEWLFEEVKLNNLDK